MKITMVFGVLFMMGALCTTFIMADSKNCHCAVFLTNDTNVEPVLVRSPEIPINCEDAQDKVACKNLCVAMAQVGKDKAPQLFCAAYKQDIKNALPSLFSRVCADTTWEHTGLTSSNPICCIANQSTTC